MNQSATLVHLLKECRKVCPGRTISLHPRVTGLGFGCIRLQQGETILAEVYDDGVVFTSDSLDKAADREGGEAIVERARQHLTAMTITLSQMQQSLLLLQANQDAQRAILQNSLTWEEIQEECGL